MSDIGGCPREDRNPLIAFQMDWCPEHESGQIKGVMFDADGVGIDDILFGTLAVLENTIAATLLGNPGPVRDYATTEWPNGKFDQTEAMRFANMVANQVMIRAVMKRSYAKIAQFHAMPGEEESG